MAKKLITRIKGGLGNQLFCYATARRLAMLNQAELIIDDVSGFTYDLAYKRKYALDVFHIHAKKASFFERMEPLGRLRRKLSRLVSLRHPLSRQYYILQEGVCFDPEILTLKLSHEVTYFDGFGQSEDYFADIEGVLRQDLLIKPPQDKKNQSMALEIGATQSVAVHVRWFNFDDKNSGNVSDEYYRNALAEIRKRVSAPHLFIFSDQAKETAERFKVLTGDMKVTYVNHNKSEDMAYADLWLMSMCKHFVIANSTFSWWGAWLGEKKGASEIFAPNFIIEPATNVTAWGFKRLLPDRWNLL
jgi:hypothetical protein